MAAVANIVLADAQATPVNHTFIPLGPDSNGVWWFEDQSASTPIGYNRLSIELKRPSNPAPGASADSSRMCRLKLGIHCPVLETISNNSAGLQPAPTVAYIARASLELMIPERSTLQNRKDLRKYAEKLFADAIVIAAAENLQSIF